MVGFKCKHSVCLLSSYQEVTIILHYSISKLLAVQSSTTRTCNFHNYYKLSHFTCSMILSTLPGFKTLRVLILYSSCSDMDLFIRDFMRFLCVLVPTETLY